jgi:hypothetical protein
MKKRHQNRIEPLQGTLDMLNLHSLRWGPSTATASAIRSAPIPASASKAETGSWYPGTQRLEKQAWVKSEWKLPETGQRTKFYRITPAGKRQLASERDRWPEMTSAIAGIMSRVAEEV